MKALQLPTIGGLQAPTFPSQVGLVPTTTGVAQIDINAIMNLMMMMMVMVMMMKMMGTATASI